MDQPRPTEHTWHSVSVAAALAAVGATPSGLSDTEARVRLSQCGANRMAPAPAASALRILRDQLTGVVVMLLVAATAISMAIRDYLEAAAIAAVLMTNATLGFIIEWRARRAMEGLRELDVAHAAVVRGGQLQVVDAEALVPGDIIEVRAGRRVSADARLVDAVDLRVNESALTGESLPVSKGTAVLDAAVPLAERTNMVFKGTSVVAGLGRGVVIATGGRTEAGKVGALLTSVEDERTPLERKLDALGRRLVWVTLGVAATVTILGALQGAPLALVVETGIALAVAAVPEALPAVGTIALAVGLRRMARRHALVRRLPAVETLGSTTVVCTDKTRTLTSGEMTVVRVWAGGREWDSSRAPDRLDGRAAYAVHVAALASPPRPVGRVHDGPADPVDAAMLDMADRWGVGRTDGHGVGVGIIPFTSGRKFVATFDEADGRTTAFVKGAPQQVLDRSGRVLTADGMRPLDVAQRTALVAVNDALARRGFRVLAAATGDVSQPAESALADLTFVGFLGLADPPAPGVKETIATLQAAGLRTIMLTGDQRLTAESVGRSIGLLGPDDRAVDGGELDRLSGQDFDAKVGAGLAFSRVTPEHKLRVVRALQARGDIVAMLGDGINDAAALKQADVGVAMGRRGTDLAKEAAAIVLQDDRFETIAAAVEEGRVIFDNIRKFVFYLFSCNVAEVLVVLCAGLAGLPLPLSPLQLLWLNIVTDTFPALALALEPGDPDTMRRPPRDPGEAMLSRAFLMQVLGFGLLITCVTVGAFIWALASRPGQAPTIAFMTLALAQIGHLGNARSGGPVLRFGRAVANPYAILGVALALCLQAMTVFVGPLAAILGVTTLDARAWIIVVVLGGLPGLIGQLVKICLIRLSADQCGGDSDNHGGHEQLTPGRHNAIERSTAQTWSREKAERIPGGRGFLRCRGVCSCGASRTAGQRAPASERTTRAGDLPALIDELPNASGTAAANPLQVRVP